jgi:hypothetical protein
MMITQFCLKVKWLMSLKKIEESFIFDDVAQGDFVLVKLAGKKSIFHYIAEVMYQQDHANGKGYSCVFQWILVDSV